MFLDVQSFILYKAIEYLLWIPIVPAVVSCNIDEFQLIPVIKDLSLVNSKFPWWLLPRMVPTSCRMFHVVLMEFRWGQERYAHLLICTLSNLVPHSLRLLFLHLCIISHVWIFICRECYPDHETLQVFQFSVWYLIIYRGKYLTAAHFWESDYLSPIPLDTPCTSYCTSLPCHNGAGSLGVCPLSIPEGTVGRGEGIREWKSSSEMCA